MSLYQRIDIKVIKETVNNLFFKIHLLPIITLLRIIIKFHIKNGHFLSSYKGQAVDSRSNPLPWLTYPAISYLNRLDMKKMNIFEYGCGNSTIFWSKKAKKVIGVEHDVDFFKAIKNKSRKKRNLQVNLADNKEEYINFIKKYVQKFDVIVIDGEYRYECAKASINHLKKDGFVILDNAETFPNICTFLEQNGLRQIDFYGFGPINPYEWNTSIFINKHFNQKHRSE